jgi:hypothetical protein
MPTSLLLQQKLHCYRRRERNKHGHMAWGGHGLPKVSLAAAMSDPSTPCGRATPETALPPFKGWLVRSAGNLQPSSTPSDTPRRTPMETSPEMFSKN